MLLEVCYYLPQTCNTRCERADSSVRDVLCDRSLNYSIKSSEPTKCKNTCTLSTSLVTTFYMYTSAYIQITEIQIKMNEALYSTRE